MSSSAQPSESQTYVDGYIFFKNNAGYTPIIVFLGDRFKVEESGLPDTFECWELILSQKTPDTLPEASKCFLYLNAMNRINFMDEEGQNYDSSDPEIISSTISSPPTLSEIIALAGERRSFLLQDSIDSTKLYRCYKSGSSWFYQTLTEAV